MNTDWVRLLWVDGSSLQPNATFYRKVRVSNVEQQGAGQPLYLRIEWAAEKDDLPAEGESGRWIRLEAAITTADMQRQPVGRIDIELYAYPTIRPPFAPVSGGAIDRWSWQIGPRDVEVVEAFRRRTSMAGPVSLQLTVAGEAQLGGRIVPVRASTGFQIEVSEWERYLGWIGYGVSPSITELVTGMVADNPAWKLAELKLETARRHLRTGETRAALEAVLTELEAICEKPYQDEAWKTLLLNVADNQKAQALARWFGGFGTYINKVGHHRDPQATAADGAVADQWEAELALMSAQAVLSEAFRVALGLRASQATPAAVASKN